MVGCADLRGPGIGASRLAEDCIGMSCAGRGERWRGDRRELAGAEVSMSALAIIALAAIGWAVALFFIFAFLFGASKLSARLDQSNADLMDARAGADCPANEGDGIERLGRRR